MSSSAPLFIELLANHNLHPAGLLLRPGDGPHPDLCGDTQTAVFLRELAAEHACLLLPEDEWLPAELSHLVAAGCRPLPLGTRFYAHERATPPTVPEGVEWLRGNWFLTTPQAVNNNLALSRSLALKLLQLVAAEADTCDIEAVFRQDPVLAYHLLRLVNSLGMSPGRHVTSFSQAILILGRQQLKRWINLMLFAANRGDHRAPMLLARASVRSRSVELLARLVGLERTMQEQAFMVGLFSLLGILFGTPLDALIERLNLSATTRDAVLHRERALGGMLNAVEAAERQDGEALRSQLDALGVDMADFNRTTLEAHRWMVGVLRDTQEKRHG